MMRSSSANASASWSSAVICFLLVIMGVSELTFQLRQQSWWHTQTHLSAELASQQQKALASLGQKVDQLVAQGGGGGQSAAGPKGVTTVDGTYSHECPTPCIDVAFLYHEEDKPMFIDNGVLLAARKHLKGIRNFYIISRANGTYKHLLDSRTFWIDEGLAPFKPSDWTKKKSARPLGWLYQQTFKFWFVKNMAGTNGICTNIMVVDSDTLWLRDFTVARPVATADGCRDVFKYQVSTMTTGAWYGDITNPEYQHFVEHITGIPKFNANDHTAINHWQVMQRDVLEALERSVIARLKVKSLHEALVQYGLQYNGMSEYEAYLSFLLYFYPERVQLVNLPYVMRDPKNCVYDDAASGALYRRKTSIMYFTCHNNYAGGDWYTNCKKRESECDPKLSSGHRRALRGIGLDTEVAEVSPAVGRQLQGVQGVQGQGQLPWWWAGSRSAAAAAGVAALGDASGVSLVAGGYDSGALQLLGQGQ